MRPTAGLACVLLLLTGCGGQPASGAAASSAQSESVTTPQAPGGAAGSATAASAPTAPVNLPKPVPAQLPDLLATVDDDRIERWELEGAVKGLESRAGSAVPADKRDEVLRGLLDQLVAYHVLVREARERKLGSTDAEFESRMSQIRSGFPTEQALQAALKARGMTFEQLQRQTRMSMDIDKLIESDVSAQISIQDADVGAFYQQNLGQFAQAESVHASHILIATAQGAQLVQKAQAKTKAEEVLKQLKAGADFATVAREQSQDPGSAPGGGDLGFFPRGQTDPAFESAAFGLKAGGLSEIVETQFGYHVIKVHEHRAARTAPLTEVSAQIKEFLAGQQRDARIQALVDQARGRRKIQILL